MEPLKPNQSAFDYFKSIIERGIPNTPPTMKITVSYANELVKIPYESWIEAGCQHLRDCCDTYCLPRGC